MPSGFAGDAARNAVLSFWIPGRIEVLGKHTDYGGGRSLLCAVERGICMVVRARDDADSDVDTACQLTLTTVRVRDAITGEMTSFDLSANVPPRPGDWSNYPITVARRIAQNFSGPLRGADIVFASDLPRAAGVSSSSALVVAVFLALAAVNDLPGRPEYQANIATPEDLGGYLGAVENGLDFGTLRGRTGVGTFGGSEDQTAILCSRPDALVQYSFRPVRFERAIAMPAGYTFVIASSGVAAAKTGTALEHYNRVSRRLGVGLECWNNATGRTDASMGAALASSPDAAAHIRGVLRSCNDTEYAPESLIRRFDQFHAESNDIIPAAADALAAGDLATFGDLVARSQRNAEVALENQTPETVTLVRQARELGAVAASAFGAGFGGSVWALVQSTDAGTFQAKWAGAYADGFPRTAAHAEFFRTAAGPAATPL